MESGQEYPNDLTGGQWQVVWPFFYIADSGAVGGEDAKKILPAENDIGALIVGGRHVFRFNSHHRSP